MLLNVTLNVVSVEIVHIVIILDCHFLPSLCPTEYPSARITIKVTYYCLEIAARGISFFTFQISFELAIRDHKQSKAFLATEQAIISLQSQNQNQIEKLQLHSHEQSEQIKRLQGELQHSQEQLGEKSRQHQRLTSIYEKMVFQPTNNIRLG